MRPSSLAEPGVVETVVRAPAWRDALGDLEALAAGAVAAARAEIAETDPRVAAVAFVDDAAQRALNARHRGADKPTNVLAFPADDSDPESFGDIVLAFETVREQARARGLALGAHVAHLIVHGFLHLRGYDHVEDADAARMEAAEIRALARLGLPDPYGERTDAL